MMSGLDINGERLSGAAAPGASRSVSPRWYAVILRRLLAIGIGATVVWLTIDLPFARSVTGTVLLVCAFIQYCIPRAWLVIVPAMLPVADLGLWSGRLYVTEFDLLVLTIIAVQLWQRSRNGGIETERVSSIDSTLILLLAFVPALWIGAYQLPAPTDSVLADYFSRYNALRVAKAFVWPFLLLPALRQALAADASLAARLFLTGVALGLLLTTVLVLWERGVLAALMTGNPYALLGTLLDFSAQYRATAIFAELHTGGEAFDTYLILAGLLAAAGAFTVRSPLPRLICIAAAAGGLYVIAVTFSRALYAAYAIGASLLVVLLVVGQARRDRLWRQLILRFLVAVPPTFLALAVAYVHGGYRALGLSFVVSGAVLLIAQFAGVRLWARAMLIPPICAGAAFALWHLFETSRYSTVDSERALEIGLGCAFALTLAPLLLSIKGADSAFRRQVSFAFLFLAGLLSIGIPVATGHFMRERVALTGINLQERSAHWAEALRIRDQDWIGTFFGTGFGSFPRRYLLQGAGPETKATYRYARDADATWLELGPGDFNMTQKVRGIAPNRRYDIELDLRTSEAPAAVTVKLCPKLILFSERYQPNCSEAGFRLDRPNQWQRHRATLESNAIGTNWPLTWPATLQLQNGEGQPIIHITNVAPTKVGAASENLIDNGSFVDGGDRWIMISDFEHLGWHIKSLYVELFFEVGLVGAIAFFVCIAAALFLASRRAFHGDPDGAAFGAALAGFSALGIFGSLLDNPRPAFLFFLLLFWSLHGFTRAGVSPRPSA